MSNLVDHARRELELLGETDPWIINGITNVVQAFADMGHSGGSASIAIPMINVLLNQENLTPLTNDPSEWEFHNAEMWPPTGIWQNRRNSQAFSNDGGKTYWLISDTENTHAPLPIYVAREKAAASETNE